MKTSSKRLSKFIIPGIVFVVIIAIAGFKYRGFIRQKMLDVLHSFDDSPAEVVEETMPPGAWWPARTSISAEENNMTEAEREQLELLRSLGYLSGYEEAPVQMSVTIYDTTRACPGYNLLISGHGPGISLMDMNGEIVHNWFNSEVSLYGIWPNAQDQELPIDFWLRALLADNGDITVMIESGGIVKLDKDSNILWTSEYNGAHHDIDVDANGNIYVIGRDIHINEEYYPDKYISEDYICILDSLGNRTHWISTLDVLANSKYAPVLRRMPDGGDVLHCNTIEFIGSEMLPENYDGPLRPGSVILSFRSIDLVCAVDIEEESVYWAESDMWRMQHHPTVLPDGTMLVYDNQGYGENSTVLQFDPATNELLWYYRGSEDFPFYSVGAGSCQRLPNGNTVIIEAMMGRAFEVTPEGDIVWEYYNPHRAGDNLDLIATLFDAERIPPEQIESWLQ
ncbi:MAG: aryl-sulfate sulfotransferase [Candidatus Sabulitectum sp.]|nr:aryl-sulfate sulfotransferase [Candidatus Sabulitectum sp.]